MVTLLFFPDFDLTSLECSVDSFIQHEMYLSTAVLCKNYSRNLAQALVVFVLTNHKEEKLLSVEQSGAVTLMLSFVMTLGTWD